MAISQVNSADSRVYVNNALLTGVTNCDITLDREVEEIMSLAYFDTRQRILKSNPTPKVSISWVLGEGTNDPFFDYQTNGLISVDSFNIRKRDIVGNLEVENCYLTSYSVEASVGSPVTASVEYEGNYSSFWRTGSLSGVSETTHSYPPFLPSKIECSSTFQEGDIFNFPVQSLKLNIPIQRKPLKKLGDMGPSYRVPELPIGATISFSVIKNDLTGLDYSQIVLEKGNFQFSLLSCRETGKIYTITGCSLVGVSESLDVDGNASIDFSYESSLTNTSFYITPS